MHKNRESPKFDEEKKIVALDQTTIKRQQQQQQRLKMSLNVNLVRCLRNGFDNLIQKNLYLFRLLFAKTFSLCN